MPWLAAAVFINRLEQVGQRSHPSILVLTRRKSDPKILRVLNRFNPFLIHTCTHTQTVIKFTGLGDQNYVNTETERVRWLNNSAFTKAQMGTIEQMHLGHRVHWCLHERFCLTLHKYVDLERNTLNICVIPWKKLHLTLFNKVIKTDSGDNSLNDIVYWRISQTMIYSIWTFSISAS